MVLHPCSRQEPPHPPWDILPSRVPQDQKEVTHETTMVGFGLRNDLIYYQVLCCRRMPRLAIFFLALSPMSRRKRKGNCPRERCGVLSLRCGKQPLLLRELPQNCVYGNQPPRTVSSRNFVWVTGEEKKTAGHHGTFHDTFWYTHHNQRMNTFEVPVCQSVESRFTSDPGVQPLWAMTFFFLNDIFLYLCQVHICGGVAYGMHTLLWAKSFKIYIFTVINSCGGVAYGVHRYRYRTRREWEDGVHPSAGDVKSWHDCT